MNYNKEISEVFDRICNLEGVVSYHGEDVAIRGGHYDDYLLVGLLSRLINEGVIDIVIKDTISERNLDYLQRLLHVKEKYFVPCEGGNSIQYPAGCSDPLFR